MNRTTVGYCSDYILSSYTIDCPNGCSLGGCICDTTKCVNGYCLSSGECSCTSGWTGPRCDQPIGTTPVAVTVSAWSTGSDPLKKLFLSNNWKVIRTDYIMILWRAVWFLVADPFRFKLIILLGWVLCQQSRRHLLRRREIGVLSRWHTFVINGVPVWLQLDFMGWIAHLSNHQLPARYTVTDFYHRIIF